MKKFVLMLFVFCLSVLAAAEEMKFVTTLSQPVGSFARVEAVNADRPARALQVNFCNNKVSSGNINVNGAVRAAYLKLDNTGSLGGNVPVYQLKTLNLGSGKDFQGGNVWANEANPAKIKADGTLYGKDMSYLVAELPALQIKDGSSVKANIINSGDGSSLEWSAQYDCDYKVTPGTAPTPQYGWTKMMRYNRDNGRFENNEGLSLYDSCDSNPVTKYTGTPSRECVDIWLDGDPNSMIYSDRGTFTVSQTDPECNAWTMECAQYYKVVPICDQKYANYNNGMQYGYGGADIKFALSSRNSTLSQSERWKKYVPNAAMVSKFFGKLKTTYNNWLNNGDWSLGHPYTYNICLVSGYARSGGIEYTFSVGTTSFKATQHFPKQEETPGGAECIPNTDHTSYVLQSVQSEVSTGGGSGGDDNSAGKGCSSTDKHYCEMFSGTWNSSSCSCTCPGGTSWTGDSCE